jgi:hypothetical protein
MGNNAPIQLTRVQREKLTAVFLDTSSLERRQWVHILILLADGHSPAHVAEATNSDVAEVEACLKCYRELGLKGFV